MKKSITKLLIALLVCAMIPCPSLALDFEFNIVSGSNLDDLLNSATPSEVVLGNNVVNGFTAAGDLWSEIYVDPITLKVTIDFDGLGPGILGSTGNQTGGVL